MHYRIRINGTMYSGNETSTLAAFHVPNCGRHEISISAVNHCAREGSFSDALLLEQNIRMFVSNDYDSGCLVHGMWKYLFFKQAMH